MLIDINIPAIDMLINKYDGFGLFLRPNNDTINNGSLFRQILAHKLATCSLTNQNKNIRWQSQEHEYRQEYNFNYFSIILCFIKIRI